MFKKILSFAALFVILTSFGQSGQITLSGVVKNESTDSPLSFVNVVLKQSTDSTFVAGTITNENGRFSLPHISPNTYLLEVSFIGFRTQYSTVYVGSLSDFLELKPISLQEDVTTLSEVEITARQAEISSKMDKKTFEVADNVSQSGGSVLQAMQNLPGVSVQEGKLELRGSDNVTVLIDGKQTALTGFGNQSGLDNIPASAIERIEIINNPSSKYDANGSAGIINIIYKKERKDGFTGKVGLTGGLGALWVKKENLPTIP